MSDIFGQLFGMAGKWINLQNEQRVAQQNIAELQRSAKLEDANAVDSLSRGSFAAGLVRRKASQAIQDQQVAFGASGVDSSYGTPANIALSTQANAEADAQQYMNNAAREAFGHKEIGRKYGIQTQMIIDKTNDDTRAWFTDGLITEASIAGEALAMG